MLRARVWSSLSSEAPVAARCASKAARASVVRWEALGGGEVALVPVLLVVGLGDCCWREEEEEVKAEKREDMAGDCGRDGMGLGPAE